MLPCAGMDRVDVNVDALKSEIRRALINREAQQHPAPPL